MGRGDSEMKKSILLFAIAMCVSATASAEWRPFETTDEARQRHSAERYETYRNNGYRAPLGGYSEKLGDPAPYGTERPGYTSPKGYGYGSPYGDDSNNSRW